jgi:hypothetical protein
MGATTIYKLPWPELIDPADAQDGFNDLTAAVDARMTRWRSQLQIGQLDCSWEYENAKTTPFWRTTLNVQRGWIEFDTYQIWLGAGTCSAGRVDAVFDGNLVRQWYFHTECYGTLPAMWVMGSAAWEVPAGKNSVDAHLDITPDTHSGQLSLGTMNVLVRQFGAG